MTDLHERLRQIERNPSPDLWEEITDRPVGSVPRTQTQHGWRRVAIIAASLAIGLAAVAWAVVAIRPESRPPSIGSVPAGTSQIDITLAADGSASASWTYGDTVLLGVPAAVVGPGPVSADGGGNQPSPVPGTLTEFLGVEGFSIDYEALGSVEPSVMSIPADVPIASDGETALLAFRAGEGQGAGYVEWGQMTVLRTPTDLRQLESGGRYRIVVVALGDEDVLFQFAFDVEVTPPVQVADASSNEVSTTYRLGDFEITYPTKSESSESDQEGFATVGYTATWVTHQYPGEGDCTLVLLDHSGDEVGRTVFGLDGVRRVNEVPASEPIAVDGEPTDVRGWCSGDPLDPSNFGQGYDFTDPRVTESQRIVGIEITYDVTWNSESSPGMRNCTLEVTLTDGTSRSVDVGFNSGQPETQSTFQVEGVRPSEVAGASVSCHPPNG
jgi:hypothetical protein